MQTYLKMIFYFIFSSKKRFIHSGGGRGVNYNLVPVAMAFHVQVPEAKKEWKIFLNTFSLVKK